MRRLLAACAALAWLCWASIASNVFAADASINIHLGIVTTPGSAQHVAAVKFKELLEEKSHGRMAVEIFHSAALGSETDILEQVRFGAVHMAIVTLGPLDVFVPEVKVVSYPFLFGGYVQVDRILDGPLGQKVLDSLQKAGFAGLAFSENGFRHVTTGKRPVHSAKDVEGLKIRVMESTLHRELWRTLGANPTPMGWPIYSELEQGTIDGQENPLWVIHLYKLYEVQKYLTLTGHVYSAHVGLANLGWFRKLPKADQDLVRDCLRRAAGLQRAWSRAQEARFLADLKQHGMVVDEHPDLAGFRAKVSGLRESGMYSDKATRSLLDEFLRAVR